MHAAPVVVKLGGSLLDCPALGAKLRGWLDALPTNRIILIVGGGLAADLIRQMDRIHHLGEERSHWLALRALSLNSHLVATLLPASETVNSLRNCPAVWAKQSTPILDPLCFVQEDEASPDRLPHCWTVTSDSVAARVARVAGAAELILLKSCTPAQGLGWDELVRVGVVDAWFPRLVASLPAVRLVNLRDVLLTKRARR
jgi:aspartokinase-like uncharacterized kinase